MDELRCTSNVRGLDGWKRLLEILKRSATLVSHLTGEGYCVLWLGCQNPQVTMDLYGVDNACSTC